jgi:hypothetical protein
MQTILESDLLGASVTPNSALYDEIWLAVRYDQLDKAYQYGLWAVHNIFIFIFGGTWV